MATTGQQGAAQVATESQIEEIVQIENPPFQQKIYVAVGNDLCESVNALRWALQNLGNRQAALVILLHIRSPLRYLPSPGVNFFDQIDQANVYMKHVEKELNNCLNKYLDICTQAKVKAEPLVVEKNDVSKGIVEVVSDLGIAKLIMGTTLASVGISRKIKMAPPGKADYVRRHVMESCDVWIVCKDKLVSHNGRKFNSHRSPCPDDFGRLLAAPPNLPLDLDSCNQSPSIFQVPGDFTPASVSEINVASDEVSSESQVAKSREIDVDEGCSQSTVQTEPKKSQDVEALKNQLREALEASENAKIEVQRETDNRKKAEAATVDANYRLECLEAAFKTTVKEKDEKCQEITEQRNKMEQNLEAMDEKINKISCERQEAIHELEAARQKLAAMEKHIKDIQDWLHSVPRVETLTSFASSSSDTLEFNDYSFDDVKAATCNFSDHRKLGEGAYATVYKGEIRKTSVAVKIFKERSLHGRPEFHREIYILRDIRHPHLVRVLGSCFERGCVINEYISNGCLADHLSCKNSTPPLPWQARIRIAAEVCSALQYLHSSKPDPVVHGNLKPQNILLDENYVSKISDFGVIGPLPQHDLLSRSEFKGNPSYMDPEYLTSAEYSTKSDVYSLGIVILQLLTGKRALGLVKEVEGALESAKLGLVLDPSAGDWPFVQATQLAYLALHCADPVRKKRPDLHPTVMKMLDQLRDMARPIEHDQTSVKSAEEIGVPSIFLCPIFQEVMQDPYVAADGFTYEREAIQGWFDCGKNTSPMTNEKLARKNLIANFSLRSAIRQWQERGDLF